MGAEQQNSLGTFPSMKTYFSSEFYNFTNTNEDSNIEDFDISQQYLRSELSEKSVILKELNRQYFLKTLEVYGMVSLYHSLCNFLSKVDQWRKINQTQKFKQKRSPHNMTKTFLKAFYLLNKKMRTKVQKSFVKIVNFTKNHDMKTYETPLVKGIKKLDQTFKTMNQKYFYNHPIKSQQMVSQAFNQIVFRLRTLKNRNELQKMFFLMNKMTSYVSLKQFYEIIGEWQRLLQKIDIFVGSLNLFVNPIKRNTFQKLKKYVEQQKLNFSYKSQIEKNYQTILTDEFTHHLRQQYQEIIFLDDHIKQEQDLNEKQKTFLLKNDQNEWILNEQHDRDKTPKKNSLTFSKDLKRKGSNQKKNQLKFKSVPGNSSQSKKIKQTKQSLQHFQNQLKQSPNVQPQKYHKQQVQISTSVQNINLAKILSNLKGHQICLSFQNSLSFQSKSSRNIIKNQQYLKLNSLRPQQLSSSFPDYFDISSYSEMPFSLPKITFQKDQILKEQNKKSPSRTFKTLKAAKSSSFLQVPIQKTLRNLQNDTSSLKPPINKISFNSQTNLRRNKLPLNQNKIGSDIYRLKSSQNNSLIQKNESSDSKKFKFEKKSDKEIQLKTKTNHINSELSSKHQYLFPISKQRDSQLGIISKIASKNKRQNHNIVSEYQTHPFQASVQKCQKALQSNNSFREDRKNTLLSFNTNRPMKKVKSSGKDSLSKAKSPKNKKQSRSKQKNQKNKKAKQIRTQYYDSRNQISNIHSYKNKQDDSAGLTAKIIKGSSSERQKIKSIVSKPVKKQK